MAKRCYKGTDSLINYWKQVRHENACFSIWDKDPASLIIYYCGDDLAEAERVLSDWVSSIEETAMFNDCYTFKTHPEGTKPEHLSSSKKYLINVDFSPNENYYMPANAVSGNKFIGASDYIAMRLDAMESKLNAIADKKIEADEDQEADNEGDAGGWLGAIQSPAGQQLVSLGALLLERLTDRFLPPKQDQKIITNLAGIPNEAADKAAAFQYVEILMQKGVTIEHLKKLSEMPGIKIKTLLAML